MLASSIKRAEIDGRRDRKAGVSLLEPRPLDHTVQLIRLDHGDATARASGWRTMWHDGLQLGMGFERLTSQATGTCAIEYTQEPEPEKLVSTVSSNLKLLSTSEDFQEVVTAGSSLSVEGWGAQASATFNAMSKVATRTNTISLLGQVVYSSEPIRVINPGKLITDGPSTPEQQQAQPAAQQQSPPAAQQSPPPAAQQQAQPAPQQQRQRAVWLKEDAYKLLSTEGPKMFHEKYGSHFVCGYTKGGSLVGYYCLEFTSREEAQAREASVKAAFKAVGAGANFKKEVQKLKSETKEYGEISAHGWSDSKVPTVVQGPEQLAAALNAVPSDNGQPLEAILCRYTDIPDYQAALHAYDLACAARGVPIATYEYFKEETYGQLVSMLNKEYLRYHCLRGLLLAEISSAENAREQFLQQELTGWLQRVQQRMCRIRDIFNSPEVAANTLLDLKAYLMDAAAWLPSRMNRAMDIRAAVVRHQEWRLRASPFLSLLSRRFPHTPGSGAYTVYRQLTKQQAAEPTQWLVDLLEAAPPAQQQQQQQGAPAVVNQAAGAGAPVGGQMAAAAAAPAQQQQQGAPAEVNQAAGAGAPVGGQVAAAAAHPGVDQQEARRAAGKALHEELWQADFAERGISWLLGVAQLQPRPVPRRLRCAVCMLGSCVWCCSGCCSRDV